MLIPNFLRLRYAVAVAVLSAILFTESALAQSTWVRPASGTIQFLSDATYGDGMFVAVGESGTIRTSPDGTSWSGETSGVSVALRSVVHADGLFVVVGKDGAILTSPDGSAWTSATSGTTNFLSGVTYGNGRYVAVGSSGKIVTSTDAITWTTTSSLTSSFLQDVHFSNGKFVAVGSSGTIRISTDGITWSFVGSPVGTTFLTGSSSFAGKHYIVGQNGTLLSSPDATSWTIENGMTLSWLRAMSTDGNTAVIVGEGGTILTSTDGTTWSPATSGVVTILSGVTFGGNHFVTVGEQVANTAVVLTSERPPGIFWSAQSIDHSEANPSATVTVARTGSLASAATINYSTVAGSAQAGIDFTSSSGMAMFDIGENQAQISIPITNNPEAEPPESFEVILSDPDPASLVLYQPASMQVNIIDAQDSDSDGLPDDWELLHFGDLTSNDGDDDPDADSNSNALELADETDPTDPNSALYRLSATMESGSGTVTVSPDQPTYPKGTEVTLTPVGNGAFSFESWTGDASGASSPLLIAMDADQNIGANFSISLAAALDDDCLDWVTSGTGPQWEGQETTTFDGIDAASASGLDLGQASVLETVIYGPATISFRWKLESDALDSLQFSVDGSMQASRSGMVDWESQSFFVGAGDHAVSWSFAKNMGGVPNQAWLDQVVVSYDFTTWQMEYFTAGEISSPAISGELADPEGDGLPNLLEYILGLDPKAHDSDTENRGSLVQDGSGFQFTWEQHKKRAGAMVALEWSDSLLPGSWQPVSEPAEVLSEDGALTTFGIAIQPVASFHRFYRLTATPTE